MSLFVCLVAGDHQHAQPVAEATSLGGHRKHLELQHQVGGLYHPGFIDQPGRLQSHRGNRRSIWAGVK